jgi:hypothetical protein
MATLALLGEYDSRDFHLSNLLVLQNSRLVRMRVRDKNLRVFKIEQTALFEDFNLSGERQQVWRVADLFFNFTRSDDGE